MNRDLFESEARAAEYGIQMKPNLCNNSLFIFYLHLHELLLSVLRLVHTAHDAIGERVTQPPPAVVGRTHFSEQRDARL